MPELEQVTEYLSEDFSDIGENDMPISESEPDSDSTPSDRRSRRRRRIAAQIEQENMESE